MHFLCKKGDFDLKMGDFEGEFYFSRKMPTEGMPLRGFWRIRWESRKV